MEFLKKEENVNQYIEMTNDYDPTFIINKLSPFKIIYFIIILTI